MMGEEDDLDSFLLGDESDIPTSDRQRDRAGGSHRRRSASGSRSRKTKRSKPPRSERRREKNSSCSSSSLGEDDRSDQASAGNKPDNDKANAGTREHRQRRGKQRQRRRTDSAMDAALASDSGGGSDFDDDGASLAAPGRRAGARPSRLKPTPASEVQNPDACESYQADDAVEARFGGRSKWFPGKIRRAHQGSPTGKALYDIDYDDGDREEGVAAGRLRRPGQTPPVLQAGLVVDVKLARKGKGYHPGTIGRVNDDGSLYVKLEDGDSEWSVPAQQVIPAYPFWPATAAASLDGSSSGAGAHDGQPSSATTGEGLSKSAVSLGSTPNTDGEAVPEAADLPPESPPCEPQAAQNMRQQHSEDSGDGGGAGGAGSGLSWIAELASSVGVPTPSAEPPMSAPNASTEEPTGEGSGLDWIAEVASGVGGSSTASRGPSAPGVGGSSGTSTTESGGRSSLVPGQTTLDFAGAPAAVLGLAVPTSFTTFSRSPNTNPVANDAPPIQAVAGGEAALRGPAAPTATTKPVVAPPPQATIPSHLTWKPITDGSASRPWGAPPPDDGGNAKEADTRRDGGVVRKMPQQLLQQQQQRIKSPPRLSSSLVAPDAASPPHENSADTEASGSQPPAPQGTAGLPKKGVLDGATAPAASAASGGGEIGGGSDRKPPLASGGDPATDEVAVGKVAPGLDTRALNGQNATPSNGSPADAAASSGGSADSHGSAVRPPGDAKELESTEERGAPEALPPLREKVGAAGRDDRGGSSTRWEIVRSSVQRRYAAEAIHLSEEVRLLTAKLKAADDKAQARLAQQERKLVAQMEEVLQRERHRMQGLLRDERAAGARRTRALKEELDSARRLLKLERSRNEKGPAHGLLGGRRARTPPPLFNGAAAAISRNATPDAAKRRGRRATRSISSRPESAEHVLRHGSHTAPVGTAASRGRSASSTTTWGHARTPERRLPPPPPPMDRSAPGRGLASTCPAATPRHVGSKGSPGVSERFEGGLSLTLTSAATAGGGFDDVDTAGTAGWRGDPDSARSPPPPQRDTTRRLNPAPGITILAGKAVPAAAEAAAAAAGGGIAGAAAVAAPDDFDSTVARAFSREVAAAADGLYRDEDSRLREEELRWKLESERRDTRRRLESMKGEVERVVGQFRARAERAEAAAASAEKRAAMKALRYLRSKRSPSPPTCYS